MPRPDGFEGTDGPLPRVLGALCAVMLLALIATGFLMLRSMEDRERAEAAQQESEMRLAELEHRVPDALRKEAPISAPTRPAPPVVEIAPAPVAETLPSAERAELLAERATLLAEIARLTRDLETRPVALPEAEVAHTQALPPPPPPPVAQAQAPIVSAPPPADPLADDLRAAIDRALAGIAKSGEVDPDELQRSLAIGPVVLPLVARRFRDPDAGPSAVRLAGALPGVRIGDLVKAASDSQCSGQAIRVAAMEAFLGLARRGDTEGLIEAARRGDPSVDVSVALIDATALLDDPRRYEVLAAALFRTPEEQRVATSLLLDGGDAGRNALLGALGDGRLSTDAAVIVLATLLPGAGAADGRKLGKAILDHDGGVPAAIKAGIGGGAAPGVVAELLAVGVTEERSALLAQALGLARTASRETLLAAALANPAVCNHLKDIARERGRTLPRSAEDLLARARSAEPLDVPDVIESIDLAEPAARADVAAVAAGFGHPEGRAVLRRLARHSDPDVRLAVVGALAPLPDVAPILVTLVEDDDLQVSAAAIAVMDAKMIPLEPARGIAALARLPDGDSELALRAMSRSVGSSEAITSMLIDALDRSAIADVHTAATFLMELNEGGGPEFAARFLGHREPFVRAAALRALRWSDGGDRERWLSVIERMCADSEPIVRVAAARALGRISDDVARARLAALVRDPSWIVREASLLGLASQERLHVVPILRRAQFDSEAMVANAARVALARHGIRDVAVALLRDLADPSVADRTRDALLAIVGARDLDEAGLAAAVERLTGTASRPR